MCKKRQWERPKFPEIYPVGKPMVFFGGKIIPTNGKGFPHRTVKIMLVETGGQGFVCKKH